MLRREVPVRYPDELILARGVGRESARIALDDAQRRRINDFYQTFVLAEQLHYFDGHTDLQYEHTRFNGIGRSGRMVHVRNRKPTADNQGNERLTAVVIGSIDHDETVVVTDTSGDSWYGFDGSKTEMVYLEPPELCDSSKLYIDDFSTAELVGKELQDYVESGTTPSLTYAHGNWSFIAHDGTSERLDDLIRVHEEVMAVARKLGAFTLPLLHAQSIDLAQTGHIDEKVLA
jgi:hypothetical protein